MSQIVTSEIDASVTAGKLKLEALNQRADLPVDVLIELASIDLAFDDLTTRIFTLRAANLKLEKGELVTEMDKESPTTPPARPVEDFVSIPRHKPTANDPWPWDPKLSNRYVAIPVRKPVPGDQLVDLKLSNRYIQIPKRKPIPDLNPGYKPDDDPVTE